MSRKRSREGFHDTLTQTLYWGWVSIYASSRGIPGLIPWPIQLPSGGGDQGGFGEEPIRPKLLMGLF
jgi:hypothetical protein